MADMKNNSYIDFNIVTLEDAIKLVLNTLKNRPEKNMLNIWADIESGQRPHYPPFSIGRQTDVIEIIEDHPKTKSKDEITNISNQIIGLLKPLELENPISPILGTGFGGTGMMVAAFGAKLGFSNPANYVVVREHIPIDKAVKPEVMGLLTTEPFLEVKAQIDTYLKFTPEEFKIGLPDMQSPFNTAACLVGSEIYYAFEDAPEQVHILMEKITEFWIRAYKLILSWVPEERLAPPYGGKAARIAECSCNLISKELYKEFVAPYDREIAKVHNKVIIHPCSGPHVFEETLDEIPGIILTEAGYIACATADSISVERALDIIGNREIILSVGEELQEGKEEETILGHLNYLKKHKLMVFNYTGMYWKKEDDSEIKELHKRLDDYYVRNFT